MNNAPWGFLNGCLRGTAKTMLEEADDRDGLDGWRRVVRTIDVTPRSTWKSYVSKYDH